MNRRKLLKVLFGAIASLPFIEAAPLLLAEEKVEKVWIVKTRWVHPDGSWINLGCLEPRIVFDSATSAIADAGKKIGADSERGIRHGL